MAALRGTRVRHQVVFTLHHAEGSPEEAAFLEAMRTLADIEGVEEFQLVREVSGKNDFRYGATMEFADQAAYDGYNEHPAHVAFVRDRWAAEVSDFLEVDLAEL
jgi:hypothetical protein